MELERELSRVLRREPPPAGFAERVMDRIAESRPRHAGAWRALAASLLLTTVGGGWFLHHEAVRRAEGERARMEVLAAFHIAGAKMRYAQREVRKAVIGDP
jgi:hypothetical protein